MKIEITWQGIFGWLTSREYLERVRRVRGFDSWLNGLPVKDMGKKTESKEWRNLKEEAAASDDPLFSERTSEKQLQCLTMRVYKLEQERGRLVTWGGVLLMVAIWIIVDLIFELL